MFDLEKYSQSLERVGYSPDSVLGRAFSDVIVALAQHNLSEDEATKVLDLLSEVGRRDLLGFPEFTEADWGEFDYGNARPGHYVRVKKVYDSVTGAPHNGLVGVIVRISGRRCSVRYLGEPSISPITHPIQNLQSLKTVVRLKTELKNLKEK